MSDGPRRQTGGGQLLLAVSGPDWLMTQTAEISFRDYRDGDATAHDSPDGDGSPTLQRADNTARCIVACTAARSDRIRAGGGLQEAGAGGAHGHDRRMVHQSRAMSIQGSDGRIRQDDAGVTRRRLRSPPASFRIRLIHTRGSRCDGSSGRHGRGSTAGERPGGRGARYRGHDATIALRIGLTAGDRRGTVFSASPRPHELRGASRNDPRNLAFQASRRITWWRTSSTRKAASPTSATSRPGRIRSPATTLIVL